MRPPHAEPANRPGRADGKRDYGPYEERYRAAEERYRAAEGPVVAVGGEPDTKAGAPGCCIGADIRSSSGQ